MLKKLIFFSCLAAVTQPNCAWAQENSTSTKPQESTPVYSHRSHSICDNLETSLSHLTDEKAKSIITGFCAQDGDAVYIDKLQITVNIQGDDAYYKEKHTYKGNYGTKNKHYPDKNPSPQSPETTPPKQSLPEGKSTPNQLPSKDQEPPKDSSPIPLLPDDTSDKKDSSGSKDPKDNGIWENHDDLNELDDPSGKKTDEDIDDTLANTSLQTQHDDEEEEETLDKKPSLQDMIKDPKLRQKVKYEIKKSKKLSLEEEIEKTQKAIDLKQEKINQIKHELTEIKSRDTKLASQGVSVSAPERKTNQKEREAKTKLLSEYTQELIFLRNKLEGLKSKKDLSNT